MRSTFPCFTFTWQTHKIPRVCHLFCPGSSAADVFKRTPITFHLSPFLTQVSREAGEEHVLTPHLRQQPACEGLGLPGGIREISACMCWEISEASESLEELP